MQSYSYKTEVISEEIIYGVLHKEIVPFIKVKFLVGSIVSSPVWVILDSGASTSRLSTDLANFLYPNGYTENSDVCIVETGAGSIKRFRNKIDHIIFLDIENNELCSLSNVIVNLPHLE